MNKIFFFAFLFFSCLPVLAQTDAYTKESQLAHKKLKIKDLNLLKQRMVGRFDSKD